MSANPKPEGAITVVRVRRKLRQAGAAAPRYTSMERRVDAAVHGLALAFAAVGLPWLIWTALSADLSLAVRVALSVYTLGLLMMLGFSALYNLARDPERKAFWRRLDRAAIFIMIAGSYTPIAVGKIADPWGTGLILFEWSLALVGAVIAFRFPYRNERLLAGLYLVMGWAILVAVAPLLEAVGQDIAALILTGGLIYTAGIGLHAAVWLKYHNAIWHACVLIAAICHYVAIYLAVTRPDLAAPGAAA